MFKNSMFKNSNENVSAPVSEGKTYDVKIEDIAQKGDGIARIEGYVIFVPDTVSGEEVTVKITRVLPKYAFATVVE
jgi:Predicted RNA-binding protein, contains TRAM domain